MNEVYVIAGGEWLRNNLNAIAAFMGTRTWDSIEKIALTLSVLAVAVMWVQRHNVMDLLGWVAVFVLISLLVNVRTSVQIIDNSDLVKVHRVDNVPVGLAMPLSLTTRIGHAMVASYEMIFTQPDSVTYSKTGMLFGAELVSKSTDFLSRNPEIANLFQDYVQNCVMGDIYLNTLFLLDESSMVGNTDMARAYALIAAGGGRAVASGDTDQLQENHYPVSGPETFSRRSMPVIWLCWAFWRCDGCGIFGRKRMIRQRQNTA